MKTKPIKDPSEFEFDISDLLDKEKVSDEYGKIQEEIAKVQMQIQEIHLNEDPSLVETSHRLAQLQVRFWDLTTIISTDVTTKLRCANQSQSWSEQKLRAQKSLACDQVARLFLKAEEMQKHQSQLKELK